MKKIPDSIERRKLAIATFYQTADLDSFIEWMLGHSDKSHLYHYVQSNTPSCSVSTIKLIGNSPDTPVVDEVDTDS
jgi:hypothetical protein